MCVCHTCTANDNVNKPVGGNMHWTVPYNTLPPSRTNTRLIFVTLKSCRSNISPLFPIPGGGILTTCMNIHAGPTIEPAFLDTRKLFSFPNQPDVGIKRKMKTPA